MDDWPYLRESSIIMASRMDDFPFLPQLEVGDGFQAGEAVVGFDEVALEENLTAEVLGVVLEVERRADLAFSELHGQALLLVRDGGAHGDGEMRVRGKGRGGGHLRGAGAQVPADDVAVDPDLFRPDVLLGGRDAERRGDAAAGRPAATATVLTSNDIAVTEPGPRRIQLDGQRAALGRG